jgi:hypothetical protein
MVEEMVEVEVDKMVEERVEVAVDKMVEEMVEVEVDKMVEERVGRGGGRQNGGGEGCPTHVQTFCFRA